MGENFTAAIIPVRRLLPNPSAHHVASHFSQGPSRVNLASSALPSCDSNTGADRSTRVLNIASRLARRVFTAQR